MFENQRYITRGILSIVPLETQLILWDLIEQLGTKTSLDYLQVFKLQSVTVKGQMLQAIEHHQEAPEYFHKQYFHVSEAIDTKLFVVDDEDHSTMLLADEY